MKNISKIAAMLLIGGSFVIQSCDGVFDDCDKSEPAEYGSLFYYSRGCK